MIDHNRRVQLADELLRRFASALRAAQLYAPSHPLVARNVTLFGETLGIAFGQQRSITLGVVGGEFVVGDVPLPRASAMMSDLLRRLQRAGVERIAIERDVTTEELTGLVQALASGSDAERRGHRPARRFRTSRSAGSRCSSASSPPRPTRRPSGALYADASNIASQLWQAAAKEGRSDPGQSKQLVDTLAQAVAQNRTALIALTALKNYDNYTFTHMVNVSILTMAQARALGHRRRGAAGVRRRRA